MTILHHPSDETLARYAAATLPAASALVVATHLDGCAACRVGVAAFEGAGGALLEELPPTPLAHHALARTIALLDAPQRARVPAARPKIPKRPEMPAGLVLPRTLQGCEIGGWHWVAPAMRWSRVVSPRDPDAMVVLVRVGPNKRLPEHGHSGTEFNQILYGSFSDGRGQYLPGDLMEADSEVEHQPIVDSQGECICIAAVEGTLRFKGWLGRLGQLIAAGDPE